MLLLLWRNRETADGTIVLDGEVSVVEPPLPVIEPQPVRLSIQATRATDVVVMTSEWLA